MERKLFWLIGSVLRGQDWAELSKADFVANEQEINGVNDPTEHFMCFGSIYTPTSAPSLGIPRSEHSLVGWMRDPCGRSVLLDIHIPTPDDPVLMFTQFYDHLRGKGPAVDYTLTPHHTVPNMWTGISRAAHYSLAKCRLLFIPIPPHLVDIDFADFVKVLHFDSKRLLDTPLEGPVP